MTLEIRDLYVSVEGKEILKGINLIVRSGEVHALMGPNGSGKSTLASAIMGHPKYKIERGDILFNGVSIKGMKPDQRALLGLFLSMQYPTEIEGVNYTHFLFSVLRKRPQTGIKSVLDLKKVLDEKMAELDFDKTFLTRHLNTGFSGGEKKRAEILQMLLMKPEIAVLDETDSGLDIDSLKIVASAVNNMKSRDFGALVITHYQRILNYLEPDVVHVIIDGKIVKTGSSELARELERKGYGWLNGGQV